jgi:hypothetical protein
VVQVEAIQYGEYSIAAGTCRGGTSTTVVLEYSASDADGEYEGLHLVLTEGVGAGQCSRIYGYTGADRTCDVLLESPPDGQSKYAITRLTGFEIGEDLWSWALASSVNGRSAAMHGDVNNSTSKAYPFQGTPSEVNRVTGSGFEQPQTFPRQLGDALKEGDVVSVWLDLEKGLLAFSVNGNRLGDGIEGVVGPVVPAASCPAATECTISIGNYRRWAAECGWASAASDMTGLTDDELLELKRAWGQFDRAGGGEIKIKAMRELLTTLGVSMTEGEMNDYLDDVDADGSGTLDRMEFFKLMDDIKANGQWTIDMYAGFSKKKTAGDGDEAGGDE